MHTCNIHTHIPEEHNNNDKSTVTTFELKGTGILFAEHLCEICGAKLVNIYAYYYIYV